MKCCSTYNLTLFTVDSASWMLSTFCPRRSTGGLSQYISGGRCSTSESVEKRYCGVLERDVLEGRSVVSKY